ncbi:MAG: GLPGLI family protein [Cyclobacteriaceae bacterium]|nr:GLPGLI family protein [Cyclobacteriaceae bacterium]
MKRIIILMGVLVGLLAAEVMWAQTVEGVITYETKIDLHRRLPPERADMKAMIPQFRTNTDNLFFNNHESIFKPLIEDDEEELSSGGGVVMRFNMPNNEFYTNRETSRTISKQEFMGKDYLIEDSVKVSPWKFGTETREILGYACQQAYYTDEVKINRNGEEVTEKREVTAWFTNQLRPFLGPDRFNTLPGAVLAVDINNGERVMVAKKIDPRPLKKNELVMPAKGTKTTQAEFRKMVDEKMKEMRANGGFMIRN